MRRWSACLGIGSMLFALAFGPLFHIHDHDDHGNPGSFMHAHLPVLEIPQTDSTDEIETPDSHQHVRWIDGFIPHGPLFVGFRAAAEYSETLPPPSEFSGRSVPAVQTLRAHGPP